MFISLFWFHLKLPSSFNRIDLGVLQLCFGQAAFRPGADGYLLPFLSLGARLSGTAAQSLSFYQLQQKKCSLSESNFLHLQCNLWNAFMDRFRSANDETVDAGLEVFRPFLKLLWFPHMTRTGHGKISRCVIVIKCRHFRVMQLHHYVFFMVND